MITEEDLNEAEKMLESLYYKMLWDGVYLSSRVSIMADQKCWDDSDKVKQFDFSNAPFWITNDSGAEPIPIYDECDLAEFIKSH